MDCSHQVLLSRRMEFSRLYWNREPFPSPEDLPDPGIKPMSLTSPALTGGFFTSATWEVQLHMYICSRIHNYTCMYIEVARLCPTLCVPVDCSLPGSSTHGIFQARVLEWVAISFSNVCRYKHIIIHVVHVYMHTYRGDFFQQLIDMLYVPLSFGFYRLKSSKLFYNYMMNWIIHIIMDYLDF